MRRPGVAMTISTPFLDESAAKVIHQMVHSMLFELRCLSMLPQVAHLSAFWHSTVYDSVLNLARRAKFVTFLFNLECELSGRSQDKNDRTITAL